MQQATALHGLSQGAVGSGCRSTIELQQSFFYFPEPAARRAELLNCLPVTRGKLTERLDESAACNVAQLQGKTCPSFVRYAGTERSGSVWYLKPLWPRRGQNTRRLPTRSVAVLIPPWTGRCLGRRLSSTFRCARREMESHTPEIKQYKMSELIFLTGP